MSATTRTACNKCGKKFAKETPCYECALCIVRTRMKCDCDLNYFREINLYVCEGCSSSINRTYESKGNLKIFLLRAVYRQLQETKSIQLSGNEAMHEGIDGLRGEIKEKSLHQLVTLKDGVAKMLETDQDMNNEGKNTQKVMDKLVKEIEAQGKNIKSMHSLMLSQNKLAEAQSAMLAEAVATQNKSAELLAESVASLNKFAEAQNSLLGECVISLNKMAEAQNHQQNELLAESVATQNKMLKALDRQVTPSSQDTARMKQAMAKIQEQFTDLLDNLKRK